MFRVSGISRAPAVYGAWKRKCEPEEDAKMKRCRAAVIQPMLRTSLPHPEIRCFGGEKLDAGDFAYNQEKILAMIGEAANQGAQLVLAPESCLDGWSADPESIRKSAQGPDGPFVAELRRTASEKRVWICAGFFEKSDDGGLYNSAILVNDSGETVLVYRKTHEKPDTLSRMGYRLGNCLSSAHTPWGRTGILICHDRWIPEAWRFLGDQGVRILLVPVASPVFHPRHPYCEMNLAHLRSCAYRESMSALFCNAASHGGHSIIISSDGNAAAEGQEGEEILFADIAADEGINDFLARPRAEVLKGGRA